jgi:hypothetical protein
VTQKQKLEVINRKLDLSLRAISIMPLFIASAHDKNPNKLWRDALRQWEEIEKQYKEILKYEDNNNTTSFENQIS